MSTTIDQQVVEMRFDNQHFERNVKTSMSTLDRLKQSLNLTGASKGLESINAAAKNNNFNVLGQSVDAVRVKFSALQIMGITALQNLTNSAINAGKRITKALTIDPIKSGFQEYETQINAVQTILANTQSKGTTLDDVNNALDTLNKYADKTIYNFTEMTRNIGTFTAAGVDLDTSVNAIQGIANLAAVSGSSAQQASTAMYQLSQALAAGTVKLMDWNSVVNAGMGGQVFQDALKETARVHGIAIDEMIKDEGSFRETLSKGWLTTEILTETLQKFTLTTEGLTDAQIKQNREMLKSKGYTDDQIDEIFKLGETATNAATKVKTFTQLWDTLQEAAQSGWTQTWEIIVGDFEEAKETLTKISDYVGNLINAFSESRNNMLEGALGSKWDILAKKIKEAGYTTEEFESKLKSVLKKSGVFVDGLINEYGSLSSAIKAGKVPIEAITKALGNLLGVGKDASDATDKVTTSVKDLEKIANKVIRGDFGIGEERVKALTKAGYDYATVQNKVNEILGDSTRHTSKLTETQKENVNSLCALSDEQLKNKGYTKEQIKALRELQGAAEGTGSTLDELISDLEKPSGRTLLLDSFKNMWKEIANILKLIGAAWKNVFGDKTTEEKSASLYNMIEKFHDLTEPMSISKESAENFKTVMEGLFSAMKLGGSLASMSLIGGLKLLNAVLDLFGTDILGVAAKLSEYIIAFNDWVEVHTIFGWDTVYQDIARVLKALYEGLSSCVKAFIKLDQVSAIIKRFRKALSNLFDTDGLSGFLDLFSPDSIVNTITKLFDKIEAWIKKGANTENLGVYIIQGLVNGILSSAKALANIAIEIGMAFIESFCALFGIASPSKVMFVIGGFIIAGLIAGLMSKSPDVSKFLSSFGKSFLEGFKNIATIIAEFLKKIDFGKLVSVGLSAGLIFVIKSLADAIALFASPLQAFTGLVDAVAGAIKNFGKIGKALSAKIKSKAMINVAIAIAILAGSLFLLSKLSWPDIGKGIVALGALAAIMVALSIACEKLNSIGSFGLNSVSIAAISLSLLMLAASLKVLSTIDSDKMGSVIEGFIAVAVGLVAVLGALAKITKGSETVNFKGLGRVFTKLAISLLLMVAVIKLMSMLKTSEIIKGTFAIALVGVLYRGIISVCKGLDANSVKESGKAIKRISVALLLMIGVVKLASMLTPKEVLKGSAVIIAIGALFAGFIYMTKYIDAANGKANSISSAGNMLLKLSASLLLMAVVIKMLAEIDGGDIAKSIASIYAIGGLFIALIAISKFSGKHAAKAGLMLLELSAAMLIFVAMIVILKELDPEGIDKAISIMRRVSLIFAGLIAVTYFAKYADKVKGTLIALTVAIGILALAIIAMSFLDPKKVATAAAALSSVIAMFALLIYATSYLNSGKKAFIRNLSTIIILTSVVAAIGGVIFMLRNVEPESAIGAATSIGILLLSLSASMAIIGNSKSLTRKSLMSTYKTIAVLVLVVGALATVIALMKNVNPASAIGSAISLGTLLIAMSESFDILAKSKSISKANLPKILTVVATLTAVIAALGFIISRMNGLNPASAMSSATALSILLLAMSSSFGIISSSKSISKANLPKIMLVLAEMTAIVAVLGKVISKMSSISPKSAIGSATAIGILLAALSASFLVVSISPSISPSALPGILVSLGMLTLVVSGLGKVISELSTVDPKNAIGCAVALSVLIATLSVALIPLALIGTFAANAVAGVLALTSMVVPLMTFAIALSNIPDVSSSEANVILLTKLMTAMTLLLAPLTLIGLLFPGALLGAVALTSMVIPLITFANKVSELPDITGSAQNISLLINLMDSMANILMKVTPLAPLAILGVAAINALINVIGAFGTFATAVGFLMQKVPSLQSFLDTGINVLAGISSGLGRVLGSFVTGFSTEVMTILPALGMNLSNFMVFATPFINGIKMVDEKFKLGAQNLASALLVLLGAQFISSLTNFMSLGTTSLSSLGRELSLFMVSAWPFFSLMSKVDPSVIESTNTISQAMLNLTKAQLLEGIARFLGADISLGSFGEQLKQFGTCIVGFSESVNGANINEETVRAAANAGLIMTELQKSIEPMDGVVQTFTGNKDLGTFGTQLSSYGKALANFSKTVSAEGAVNETAIQSAANAGRLMTEMQKSITPTKGVLQWLTGTKALDTFGSQLKKYGSGLSAFSKSISGENAIDTGAIQSAAAAGKLMAAVQKSIPSNKWLDGKISIDTFGKKICKFGKYIADYSDKLADVNSASIMASTVYARRLVTVANSASTIDSDKVSKFKNIKTIGAALETYSEKISGVESGKILSSISYARQLASFIRSLSGIDTSGVSSFKSAVSSLGKTNLSSFVNAFKNAGSKLTTVGGNLISSITKGMRAKQSGLVSTATSLSNVVFKTFTSKSKIFTKVGSDYVNNLVRGITSHKARVSSAVGSIARSGASSARGSYHSFYSAGSYLVSGFASGISSNTWKATAKARAMANAAAKAAKDALKINSPSKVFMAYGSGVVEGFVKGINDNTIDVIKTSRSMADSSVSTFGNAIARVSDYLNSDMDVQPTIRPVLDLTDIKAGASTIGSMFGKPSVGVMTNLGSINTNMRRMNQNGANDDVVSAINKLRSALENTGGTTYQINGITYDDGSNIDNAVADLIRAIRMEGRM